MQKLSSTFPPHLALNSNPPNLNKTPALNNLTIAKLRADSRRSQNTCRHWYRPHSAGRRGWPAKASNMATTSSMFMYSLTIQSPGGINQAILGQFAGTKEQQIVTSSGSKLTLLRPDAHQGKITPILTHDVFGIIRNLAVFRLAGSNKGMFSCAQLSEASFSDSLKHAEQLVGQLDLIAARASLLVKRMLRIYRLLDHQLRFRTHHYYRVSTCAEQMAPSPFGNLWQIWHSTCHTRSIFGCRPKGQSMHDSIR